MHKTHTEHRKSPLKRTKLLRYFIITVCIYLIPNTIFSQQSNTITVTVTDGDTKEPLIGVSVFSDDKKFVSQTDADGKVGIPELAYREKINFSYVGYTALKIAYSDIRNGDRKVKMYSVNIIDGVVVIGRTDIPEDELPYKVDRISAEKITSRNSQTTADVLADHANVFVQKTQMGGGSPVIRGFEANRVLLVLDGIRMNNAIYRSGHLQNSITVDASILEQAEVIHGPGSLMYGSEALGGVIHFRTREPRVSFSDTEQIMETRAYARFSSANLEKTVHADFEYGAKEWASLTSFTYSDFGDLKAGSNWPDDYPDFGKRPYFITTENSVDQILEASDPSIQKVVGYRQIDFLQKIKYQPKESLYFIGNFQYSTTSNVPRYDYLTDTVASASDLKWAEWYYGPQNRLLSSLTMKAFEPKLLYNKAIVIAAFQYIEEDRLNRRFRRDRRNFNLEDVFVYSFTADFEKGFGNSLLSYGLDENYNRVFSEAGDLDIETGLIRRRTFTRFPSDYSTLLSSAAYVNYRWTGLDSLLAFDAGVRYTRTDLFAKYKKSDFELIQWPEEYVTSGVSSTNSAFTYGLGLTLSTRDQWKLRLLVSTAFRSPNIDDFAKLRVNNGKVLLPNTDLKPEHTTNGEATLMKTIGSNTNSLKVSATGFYTILKDVIVRKSGQGPNGEKRLWVPSELDSFDIQQNFNAKSGFIYGTSANVLLKIMNDWELSSGINYTVGRVNFENAIIDTLVPLDHIPPLYGQTSMAYNHKKIRLEAVVKYNAKKPVQEYAISSISKDKTTGELEYDLLGSEDNPNRGIAYYVGNDIVYEGIYGWTTFNIYGSYAFNKKFSIDLAVENITDKHYRTFSSGVSAPGRNFIIALRGVF